MAVAATFLLLWAILVASKGTPFGKLLNRVMVELPAMALNRLQRGHVALAIVVTLLMIVALCFPRPDSLRMTGLAIPDFAAWLTTVEIGTYLDVVASFIWRGVHGAAERCSQNCRQGVFARLAPARPPATSAGF